VRGEAGCEASTEESTTNLKLAIGPSWDLNDHVQDGLLLVGIERDIVEGRNRNSILLDVNAVLKSVRRGDLADGVLRSHVCSIFSSG